MKIAAAMMHVLCVSTCLAFTLSAQMRERIEVAVYPDSVVVADIDAHENCASRFAVSIQMNGTDLIMTQTDTIPDKMRCMCVYRLETVLRGLDPGTYTVHIQREYLAKFGYGSDTLVQIGDATFVVGNVSGVADAFYRQGPCVILGTDDIDVPDPLSITVATNPAHEQTTVSIRTDFVQQCSISLYSVDGKNRATVYQGDIAAGNSSFLLPTAEYQSGLYYLVVKTPSAIRAASLHIVH